MADYSDPSHDSSARLRRPGSSGKLLTSLSIGPYLIEKEIARGTGSIVYRGLAPQTPEKPRERVVVKVRLPEKETVAQLIEHTKLEAQFHQLVCPHPHLLPLAGWGEDKDQVYIAFPYIDGIHLDHPSISVLLGKRGIMRLMGKLARTLHHLHTKGLVHRDVKPANIMVHRSGEPFLIDLGQCWKRGDKSADGGQHIVGAAAYMSPEQGRGEEEKLNGATDLYSLGVVLFEALTGRVPFVAETPWKTIQLAVNTPPPLPRELNSEITEEQERVILSCMEKDPALRYSSGEELAKDLDRLADQLPIQGPSTSIFRRIFRS